MDGIFLNSFGKGMNSDFAKTIQQKDSYLNALNFRITTENGQSTGILSNVKGNTHAITFPDTGNVLLIRNNGRSGFPATLIFSITANSTTVNFSYSPTFPADDINGWIELANTINADSTIQSLGIIAFATGLSITLYSTLNYIITFTSTSLVDSTLVAAQTNLVPIGSTNIRDEIIILTTSEDNILPDSSGTDGTPNSGTSLNIGQIWKLTYDESKIDQEPLPANIFTLTLLYNNKLNFSLTHPIAPSAIKGNYENDDTKKIYWCDFFNRAEVFNTADPNGFFLDVSLIDTTPNLNMSVPILQSVNNVGSGVLTTGMYQYTYRLLNTQGDTTPFSPLSNLLHLVTSPETSNNIPTDIYISNAFATGNTGKSVTIKIQGIDTNYDRIQIAYVNRTSITTVPNNVTVFYEDLVDISGIVVVTHTGSELLQIAITNDELTNPLRPIDTYKSNAIKDSLLLIANIKTSKLDLSDIFDAKAYRYNHAGTTYSGISNPNDINPNQKPDSWNNYLYQQDGVTLGGKGANISYNFVYKDGVLQTNLDSQQTNTGPYPAGPQYRSTGKITTSYNFGIPSQTFPASVPPAPNFFIDPISPYIETIMKGYQRDETYRFGIVFYDKKGFPGFVQWIADIRFPSIYMPNLVSSDPLDRSLQFSMSSSYGQNYYGLPIGIRFTVNTSLINDRISGYSIVRVKREQGDKTVLAQGLIQPSFRTNPAGTSYVALIKPATSNLAAGFGFTYDQEYANLISPETFFGTFGGINGGTADYVEIVDTINSVNGASQGAYTTGGSLVTGISAILKLYASVPKTINSTYRGITGGGGIGKQFQVHETKLMPQFSSSPDFQRDSSNQPIANIAPGQCYTSQGGQSLAIRTNGSGITPYTPWKNVGYSNGGANFLANDGLESTPDMYLAMYKRNLVNQYGGNTISERSRNDYMSCNHYQPVASNQSLYSSTIMGGDVWVQIMDQNDQRKPWIHAASELNGTKAVGEGGCGGTTVLEPKFFVCESCINVNTRTKEGPGPNVSYPTVNTTSYYDVAPGLYLDINESSQYNPMFSEENDIQTFLPKPDPFIEQNVFDNRVYASNVKINGELTDNWTIFPQADYRDVDGVHGPINGLATFANQVHFLQDRAVGIIPIYSRAVLNNAGIINAQLQIGLGNKIDRHQYISTDIGSKHQWSIVTTGSSLYFYDVLSKKQMKYSPGNQAEPLSDIKGLHAFFDRNLIGDFLNHDNPILKKGVTTVYDFKNNDILLTFHDQVVVDEEDTTETSFTIAYNELADCFTSFYSFKPTIYLTNRQIYLSPSDSASNSLYVHSRGSYSSFYGTIYPSTLTTIVNENPLQTKVYDNQVFETEAINTTSNTPININNSIFNTIRMYNDYQNTDFQTLTYDSNIKRKERSFNIVIPRNRVLYTIGGNSPDIFTNLSATDIPFAQRIRDKYLTCDYIYNNTNGYRFLVHNIQTKFRISPR